MTPRRSLIQPGTQTKGKPWRAWENAQGEWDGEWGEGVSHYSLMIWGTWSEMSLKKKNKHRITLSLFFFSVYHIYLCESMFAFTFGSMCLFKYSNLLMTLNPTVHDEYIWIIWGAEENPFWSLDRSLKSSLFKAKKKAKKQQWVV